MGQSVSGNDVLPTLSVEEQLESLGGEVTVDSFAQKLATAGKKSVVVVCGAGISVSAGIPDFRTPGSGLYDNLQKYDLPTPESIFTLEYFREHPLPFFQLAKEIYPGNFAPTPTHAFIKLLQDKGLLRRCFTQNIDTLERAAGVNPSLLVEAHGSFGEAHCLECKGAQESKWIREEIFADRVPVLCPQCGGLVKPDIVFFGEPLPKRFKMLFAGELPEAQFLIVMGSSLQVEPFASTINQVSPLCPRLLVNRELAGVRDRSGHGFRFDAYDNYRDVALLADCDSAVRALAERMGWLEDLEALIREQKEAHVSSNKGAEVVNVRGETKIEMLHTSLLTRSWRRHFLPDLPKLCNLGDESTFSPEELAGTGAVICMKNRSGCVEELDGGELLEVAVRHCWSCTSAWDRLYLAFVPSGSNSPEKVFQRTELSAPAQDGIAETSTVALTVPPLLKAQVENGEVFVYELWLIAERCKEDGRLEGAALARAGPIRTAANSAGVRVANGFARLAVRGALAERNSKSKDTSVNATLAADTNVDAAQSCS